MLRKLILLFLVAPLFAQTSTFIPGGSVNSQLNSYSAVAADVGKIIKINCSACVLTLPSPPPYPNWTIIAKNVNASNLTINPNGVALDDSFSDAFITQGQWLQITTDGFSYTSLASGGTIISGGGSTPTLSVTVNPSSIAFGTVQNNTVSDPQVVTITNNGNIAAIVNSAAFATGTKFTTSNIHGCDGLLDAGGGSCSLLISYAPTASTSDTDTLSFTSNAPIDLQNPLTVSLSGTGQAGATFPITLAGFGLGSGTVIDTNNANSINATISNGQCSGTCTFNYPSGTSVVLTATANMGSTFAAFNGASLTTSPGTFAVSQSQSITATFDLTPPSFTLTISCAGQGTGTVTSDDSQINAICTGGVLTGAGQGTYTAGSAPVLTESPSGGCAGGACTFNSWGGVQGTGGTNCTTGANCTPTINANTNISASFALATAGAPFQLIQKISGGTAGTNNITGVWPSTQQAGDTNVVGLQWNDATTTVSSITDTVGNTYAQLGGSCSPSAGNGFTTAIYIANSIAASAAGANTITVALSAGPSYRGILAIEYSGLNSTPLDVCAKATGTGSPVNAGNLVTTNAADLLFSNSVVSGAINTPSSGWAQEIVFHANDVEDRTVSATGTYNNSTTQTGLTGFSTIAAALKIAGTVPVSYSFNVLCGGSGSGTVTTAGISLTCSGGVPSGTSSAQVAPGTVLSVVAAPIGTGSSFGGFQGAGCSGVSPCPTSAITTNTTLTANFNAAGQTAYFVNISTGNDANSGLCAVAGTPAGCSGPWQHISKAIAAFTLGTGGTVVHVADGVYANPTINRGGGSITQRLVIQCDNGIASAVAAQGHCKFTGSGTSWILSGGNNFDIRGMDIGGNANMLVAIDGLPCGPVGSSTCLNSVHIIGNYIHDLAGNAPLDANGCVVRGTAPGAILIPNQHGYLLSDLQVIGNIVFRNGPLPKAGCNSGPNGFYIDTGGSIIENNLIVQTHNFGIQVYGQPCNTRLSNNTLITNHWGLVLAGGGEGVCTPGRFTIDNNLLLNSLSAKFGNSGVGFPCTDTTHQAFYGKNITDGVGADFDNTTFPSCVVFGSFPLTHASGASLFVNYQTDGTGNYQLKSTSPAINGGTATCVTGGQTPCIPNFDILNVSRPQRATFDIGAYELP